MFPAAPVTLPGIPICKRSIGHTVELFVSIPEQAAKNIVTVLNGTIPENCRNPEAVDL